jgi:hypothetical protein
LGADSLSGWNLTHLMKDLAMLELITASPGLLAGLGLYIATAAVILTSRSPEADDEKTP